MPYSRITADSCATPSCPAAGKLAYGTKFVVVAARSGEARGRMILDVDRVPDKGGEAKAAMGCFERLAPSSTRLFLSATPTTATPTASRPCWSYQ